MAMQALIKSIKPDSAAPATTAVAAPIGSGGGGYSFGPAPVVVAAPAPAAAAGSFTSLLNSFTPQDVTVRRSSFGELPRPVIHTNSDGSVAVTDAAAATAAAPVSSPAPIAVAAPAVASAASDDSKKWWHSLGLSDSRGIALDIAPASSSTQSQPPAPASGSGGQSAISLYSHTVSMKTEASEFWSTSNWFRARSVNVNSTPVQSQTHNIGFTQVCNRFEPVKAGANANATAAAAAATAAPPAAASSLSALLGSSLAPQTYTPKAGTRDAKYAHRLVPGSEASSTPQSLAAMLSTPNVAPAAVAPNVPRGVSSLAAVSPSLTAAAAKVAVVDEPAVGQSARVSTLSTIRTHGFSERVIQQIQQSIVMPLLHPQLFKAIGVKASRGVLLVGAPGTGKNMLMQILINAIPNVHYQSLDSSYLLSAISTGDGITIKPPAIGGDGAGTGSGSVDIKSNTTSSAAASGSRGGTSTYSPSESTVPSQSREQAASSAVVQNNVTSSVVIHPLTSVLATARKYAPSLVFIDDVDIIASKRANDESPAVTKMRALLRVEIDKLTTSNANVIVVAATQNADGLCDTLRRTGRWNRQIVLTTPNTAERLEMLKTVTKDMRLHPSVSLSAVAERTAGYVGADIKGLCVEAGLTCIRSGIDTARRRLRRIALREERAAFAAEQKSRVGATSTGGDTRGVAAKVIREQKRDSQPQSGASAMDTESDTRVLKSSPAKGSGDSDSDSDGSDVATSSGPDLVIDDELLSRMIIDYSHFDAAISNYTSSALRSAGSLAVNTQAGTQTGPLRSAESGSSAAAAAAAAAAGAGAGATPRKKKMDELGGNEGTKKQLMETLSFPLLYPQLFAKYGLSASSGLLLYGPAGCGKTAMAHAIASDVNASLLVVRGAELFSAYTGEGEKNIRHLFAKARQTSPTVIFFDEIDALGRARKDAGPGGDSSAERILNQLLIEMDSRPPATQKDAPVVFVIGATNRPDILDHALIRPGRLDQLIYVGLPDRAARISILQTLLRSTPLDSKLCADYAEWRKSHPPKASANATAAAAEAAVANTRPTLEDVLSDIADRTEQFSGADLAAILNRARRYAISEQLAALSSASATAIASPQSANKKQKLDTGSSGGGGGEHAVCWHHISRGWGETSASVTPASIEVFQRFNQSFTLSKHDQSASGAATASSSGSASATAAGAAAISALKPLFGGGAGKVPAVETAPAAPVPLTWKERGQAELFKERLLSGRSVAPEMKPLQHLVQIMQEEIDALKAKLGAGSTAAAAAASSVAPK